MHQRNKVLLALSAIALGSAALPGAAAAQEATVLPQQTGAAPQQAGATSQQSDAEFRQQCDWLSQQSKEDLQAYLRTNPNDDCAEVAALMLVAQTQAAQSASGVSY